MAGKSIDDILRQQAAQRQAQMQQQQAKEIRTEQLQLG